MGQRVEWVGRVVRIYGKGEVSLNVDPSGSMVNSVSAHITVSREDHESLKQDRKVTFQGDIGHIKEWLGPSVHFKRVTIVDK